MFQSLGSLSAVVVACSEVVSVVVAVEVDVVVEASVVEVEVVCHG